MSTLYQISTFEAFGNRGFDGQGTVEKLLRHGDTGFGTYHALDGEMIVLDGTAYKAKGNCLAERAEGGERTPFATIAAFSPDICFEVSAFTGFEDLCRQLDKGLAPQTHEKCFIGRLEGCFTNIEIHSVWPVIKPYEALDEIVSRQECVTLENTEGVLVGVRCPEWAGGKNFIGWHFHFLSRDKKWGGHVNQVSGNQLSVRLKVCGQIEIIK